MGEDILYNPFVTVGVVTYHKLPNQKCFPVQVGLPDSLSGVAQRAAQRFVPTVALSSLLGRYARVP